MIKISDYGNVVELLESVRLKYEESNQYFE